MEELIGISASAAGGGVFGLVGTALGRLAGFLERRQTHEHERARWAHESALLNQEIESRRIEEDAALSLASARGGWAAFQASIDAEAAISSSYVWVDAVRGLTRPVLTLLLWLIAGAVYFVSDASARTALIETTTFAATAATLWWFGDRGPRQKQSG